MLTGERTNQREVERGDNSSVAVATRRRGDLYLLMTHNVKWRMSGRLANQSAKRWKCTCFRIICSARARV